MLGCKSLGLDLYILSLEDTNLKVPQESTTSGFTGIFLSPSLMFPEN